MQKRNALLCGAALGVLIAGSFGAAAEAAPRHHHHAAATTSGSETQEKIDSLTAAVSTLESRLNDEAAARQADEARAQAAEAKADAAEADAQATRTEMQAQIQTIPSDVQTAVASVKPKTDKIYYKGVTITPGGFLEAAGIYRSKNEDIRSGLELRQDPVRQQRRRPYPESCAARLAKAGSRCWSRATSARQPRRPSTPSSTSWARRRPPTRTRPTRSTRASATCTERSTGTRPAGTCSPARTGRW